MQRTDVRMPDEIFEEVNRIVWEKKKKDRKYSQNKFINAAIAEKIAREAETQ